MKSIMKRIMAALLLAAVLSGSMISSLASCSIKVEAADKTTTAALKKEFDADFYATKYPDIKAAFGTNKEAMFNHFLTFGMKEGRMMNANFDPVAYVTAYPDVKATLKKNDYSKAYEHYVVFGKKEGRTLTTNAQITKKAAATKKVVQSTTYQVGLNHGLTVYLNDSQYKSCTIKIYKSDNGYGAYIDGSLYDTSGSFNSGSCYQYSSVNVNNGNWSETVYSQPQQQQQKVQPAPAPTPAPTPTPTPDPEPEADDDDDEEMSDEDAAILWILVIVGELQQKLENGEITQEEYDEAMAELGL